MAFDKYIYFVALCCRTEAASSLFRSLESTVTVVVSLSSLCLCRSALILCPLQVRKEYSKCFRQSQCCGGLPSEGSHSSAKAATSRSTARYSSATQVQYILGTVQQRAVGLYIPFFLSFLSMERETRFLFLVFLLLHASTPRTSMNTWMYLLSTLSLLRAVL